MEKKKQLNYPQKFRQAWLKDPKLKDWLRENASKSNKSYCIYCKCDLISKYCDLRNHASTKKHLRAGVAYQQQQLSNSLPMIINSCTNDVLQLRQKNESENKEIMDKLKFTTDHIEIESLPHTIEEVKVDANERKIKSLNVVQESSIQYHQPFNDECIDEEDEEFTEILNLADVELETAKESNAALQEKRTRAEIAYFEQKTEYFAKLTENTKIHKTLMILQARKLNLEIKKMQNEVLKQ